MSYIGDPECGSLNALDARRVTPRTLPVSTLHSLNAERLVEADEEYLETRRETSGTPFVPGDPTLIEALRRWRGQARVRTQVP